MRGSVRSLLTRISTWVPVASIRATRSAPGKFRSMTKSRSRVKIRGLVSIVSSSDCSPSALGPPEGPETTARAPRVEASVASRSRTCG